mgnify:FL=1
MEKVISLNENALDVTFNLKTYLEAEFDFVYNHNNFFIVANNDAPINSLANTTAEDIWLKIIDYVKELMIEPSLPDADRFYKKLSANFVLAYGSHTSLDKQTSIILEKFNRKLIPLYNDHKLDYTYLNSDITITRLDSIIWKPLGFNKKYNKIIETVFKIIIETLSIAYPTEWSLKKLDNLYITLNRDVENGFHMPSHYDVDIAIMDYIYQIWILIFHDHKKILSPEQKKIEALLYKYKSKGIPFNISSDLTKVFEIDKKIIYRDRTQFTFFNDFLSKYVNTEILIIVLSVLVLLFIVIMLRIYKVF